MIHRTSKSITSLTALKNWTMVSRVSGVVRVAAAENKTEKMTSGNIVPSAQIANVRIEQRGRGAQAEAQGIGWLSRFFLNVLPI